MLMYKVTQFQLESIHTQRSNSETLKSIFLSENTIQSNLSKITLKHHYSIPSSRISSYKHFERTQKQKTTLPDRHDIEKSQRHRLVLLGEKSDYWLRPLLVTQSISVGAVRRGELPPPAYSNGRDCRLVCFFFPLLFDFDFLRLEL